MDNVTIRKVEVRDKLYPDSPQYYVRGKNGDCSTLSDFAESWAHFISDDGYRVSFAISETQIMTVWRKVDWSKR